MISRREVVINSFKSATLLSMGPTVPTFLAQTAQRPNLGKMSEYWL